MSLGDDPDRIHWPDLVEEGIEARKQHDGAAWRLGDLAGEVVVAYGGQDLQRYAEEIGVNYNTLQECRRVAGAFEKSRRLDNLSWSHHHVLAAQDDRLDWLARAAAGDWSAARLREELANAGDYRPAARALLAEATAEPSTVAVGHAADVLEAAAREPERFADLVPQMARTGRASGALRELRRRGSRFRLAEREPPPIEGSGESNGILPLEVLWPSAQDLLRGLADKWLREVDKFHQGPSVVSPAVLEVPGVSTVLKRLEAVVDRAARGVDQAAAALREIAELAPTHTLPLGSDAELLLLANARQKNSRGFCGHPGCWQAAATDGRCAKHPPGGTFPPGVDPVPPEVYRPATPGNSVGTRPGWSSWGLEAFERLDEVDGPRRLDRLTPEAAP